MHKYLPIVVPFLALVVFTLACNGDGTPGATPTPGETPTSGPSETPTYQPSPTSIGGTPALGETPTTVTPTASPIPMGTPAIALPEPPFYEGVAVEQEECLFDPRIALATCPGRGLYTIDPPLTGEDISCSIFIVDEEPVVLLCRSREPQESRYYAIQEGAP